MNNILDIDEDVLKSDKDIKKPNQNKKSNKKYK